MGSWGGGGNDEPRGQTYGLISRKRSGSTSPLGAVRAVIGAQKGQNQGILRVLGSLMNL